MFNDFDRSEANVHCSLASHQVDVIVHIGINPQNAARAMGNSRIRTRIIVIRILLEKTEKMYLYMERTRKLHTERTCKLTIELSCCVP